MEPIHEEEYKGLHLVVAYDEFCEDPRSIVKPDEHVVKFAFFHRRYDLENTDNITMEQAEALTTSRRYVTLKVYMYDHSGVHLSTSRVGCFADSWDAGCIGIAYVKIADAHLYLGRVPGSEIRARIERLIEGEVEEYGKYINGECYQVSVSKSVECDHGDTHYDELDSTCGCIGFEHALDVVREMAEEHAA